MKIRSILLGLPSMAAGLGAADAVSAGPPSEVVVELPVYVVEARKALSPQESWRYVSVPALELTKAGDVRISPGYEVLSNFSVADTQLLARELQRHQLVAALIWPLLLKPLPRESTAVVVDVYQSANAPPAALELQAPPAGDAGEPAAVPVEHRLESNLSRSYGWQSDSTTEPGATTAGAIDPASPATGFSLPMTQPLSARFARLARSGGGLAALVKAAPPSGGEERPSPEQLAAAVSRERALFALNVFFSGRSPPWLRAGIGWLIATTEVTPTKIQFAAVPATLSGRAMPSLRTVLSKTASLNHEEELVAAAFTHFALYGGRGQYAQRFLAFATRAGQQPFTDALWEEAFHKRLSQIEVDLAGYMRNFSDYRYIEMRGELPELPAVTVRPASIAEVARLRGRITD